eukprot:10410806-Karenia_brevis.AAC.1
MELISFISMNGTVVNEVLGGEKGDPNGRGDSQSIDQGTGSRSINGGRAIDSSKVNAPRATIQE